MLPIMALLSPISGQPQPSGTKFRRTDRVEAAVQSGATRADIRPQSADRRRRNLAVAFDRRGARRARTTAPALEATFVAQVIAQAFGFDQKPQDSIQAYARVKTASVAHHDVKA